MCQRFLVELDTMIMKSQGGHLSFRSISKKMGWGGLQVQNAVLSTTQGGPNSSSKSENILKHHFFHCFQYFSV